MLATLLATATAATATGVAVHGIFAPRSQLWGRVVWRGDRAGAPRVALTFDDGPHPEATPRVLDALARSGVRATFFVIGQHAERWPALVRRIHDEGHLVGNHSYAHSLSGSVSLTGYWEDSIRRTRDVLEAITGRRPAWFRPPFAVKQWHLCRAAARTQQTVVTFSRRALDGRATAPDRIIARLVPRATAGDILALHDGVVAGMPRPIEPTLRALPVVLDGLRGRELAVVPLADLIAAPPYQPPR
ncbi:MAG TPA: polysaccharide deacetylase family protein [Polyangia bacterium]|nr:polysaccharide deacetylase family protein [Polyangia bacterium]